MKRLAILAAALLAVLAPLAVTQAAWAQDNLPPAPYAYRQLEDPAQEAKARALMETLRCLMCQSQSIADSDAPIAGDMRHQVRTRIAAGESPEEIRQWLLIYQQKGTKPQLEAWIAMADRQLEALAAQKAELDMTIDDLRALRETASGELNS